MLQPILHHISPLFPNFRRGARTAELPNIMQIWIAQPNEAEGAMEEVGEPQEVVTVRWALFPVLWHLMKEPLLCLVVGHELGVSSR